ALLSSSLCCCELRVVTGLVMNNDPRNNVTPSVAAKIGRDLHRRPAHPLCIIKER
ncbi:unnamed protein product, partial [Sphacelaria rigidula]